jgi:hypothetical protein
LTTTTATSTSTSTSTSGHARPPIRHLGFTG